MFSHPFICMCDSDGFRGGWLGGQGGVRLKCGWEEAVEFGRNVLQPQQLHVHITGAVRPM